MEMPSSAVGKTRRAPALAVLLLLVLGVAPAAAGARIGAAQVSVQPLGAQTIRYWTGVASCETGAGGPPKWDWGSKHRSGEGTLFEGGVGFSAGVWQSWATELGLIKLYPHAYDAPPLVQIRVAQYGFTIHGARWGCAP
jgi:hypothetical protein